MKYLLIEECSTIESRKIVPINRRSKIIPAVMEVHIKHLTTKRTFVKINILLFIIFFTNSSKQKFLPHKNIFTHSFVSIDDYPMSKKKIFD
jgi:hypothetical protein